MLAVLGLTALALLLVLYGLRRTLAREALTAWLRSKGVTASAHIDAVGLSDVVGALRVGDPRHPDFTAERAEVSYGVRGFGLQVTAVRLTRPVLRAELHGGRLSFGALDPLIAELRKRPPQPGAPSPRIEVDDGTALLATNYGPVRLTADLVVQNGRLRSLRAASAPTTLTGDGFRASLGAGALSAKSQAGRLSLSLAAPIVSASGRGLSVEQGRLTAAAQLAYPDLKARRADGPVSIRLALNARGAAADGRSLLRPRITAGFHGVASGSIDRLVLTGHGAAELIAAGARVGRARLGGLHAALTAPGLRWSRLGDELAATVRADAVAEDASAAGLTLAKPTVSAQGRMGVGRGGLRAELAISASGRGAWSGLGPPTASDTPDLAAVKRAARSFRLSAPGLRLEAGGGGPQVRLAAPVLLTPAAGGAVRLVSAGSGWRLAAGGGGLPSLTADITHVARTFDGLVAAGRLRTAISIGPAVGGTYDAAGELRISGGGASFVATRCAQLKVARLDFGKNEVTDLDGRLCPAVRPLLSLAHGDWRIAGRAQALSAKAPFLQAKVRNASGPVDFGAAGGALHARISGRGELDDMAAAPRYWPLQLDARADLAHDLWTARLTLDHAGQPIARAQLNHDARSGRGGVTFDTGLLRFAQGGLQPSQLSPMAGALGPPVDGQARFSGAIDWTPTQTTSRGLLEIPHLDFQSPAGRLKGLAGRIALSSLLPLQAEPGQTLHADELAAVIPVTGLTASFAIAGQTLHVSRGAAAVGGGTARIERLDIPLGGTAALAGVLDLEGVQLHDLVEASPFAKRVDFDAKVSGRIPFRVQDGKVRVSDGRLHAIQPGRLSIDPAGLTTLSAAGGPATAAAQTPQGVSDLAYQALQDLAFTTLDAEVDSRPDGRLGVLFHIVGRHDPPQHQEIRLTWLDLIRRDFLNRKLPLPSGTQVNLTLDTSLNLDQLLSDYAEYQRLRSSAPVQPPVARTGG